MNAGGREPASNSGGREPARLAALLLAALGVVVSVTFHFPDTDTWQHLALGRAIWTTHSIPTTQVWTWPTYGAPNVEPSWGFSALIWPFWRLGGTWGLFAWKWLSTLATFGLLAVAARRMGARGFGLPAALLACAVLYRLRVQVRPETLAGLLLAGTLAILETRRSAGRDRTAWLPVIALVWANVHVSAFLFFVLLGAYALHDLGARGTGRARLPILGAIALVAMLVNPWGWRTLAQPFEYWLTWRHEPIFATIGELGRPRWGEEVWNGAAVIGLAVPALAAWRARRRGIDVVQLVLLLVFAAMAFTSMRFLGFLALVIAPFLARDLDDWLATRNPSGVLARPSAGLVLVAAVALLVAVPSWTVTAANFGVAEDLDEAPVAACDVIARDGVRGRAFNQFELGGYLLWRFWPERDRLPFLDVHVAGTREDRLAYPQVFGDPAAWRALDAKYRFEWLLLRHRELPGSVLLDALDADSSWALLSLDDVAALYVRRSSPAAALAFHVVPAGHEGMRRLGERCIADSSLREAARAELERMAAESHASSGAHTYLSLLAELDDRFAGAMREQRAALAVDDRLPRGWERLGDLALRAGDPQEALEAWRRAGSDHGPGLERRRGLALMERGEHDAAIAALRRALREDPGDLEAADSLAALEERGTAGAGRR